MRPRSRPERSSQPWWRHQWRKTSNSALATPMARRSEPFWTATTVLPWCGEREEQQRVGADHHARDGHHRPDRVDHKGRRAYVIARRALAHESKPMPLPFDWAKRYVRPSRRRSPLQRPSTPPRDPDRGAAAAWSDSSARGARFSSARRSTVAARTAARTAPARRRASRCFTVASSTATLTGMGSIASRGRRTLVGPVRGGSAHFPPSCRGCGESASRQVLWSPDAGGGSRHPGITSWA